MVAIDVSMVTTCRAWFVSDITPDSNVMHAKKNIFKVIQTGFTSVRMLFCRNKTLHHVKYLMTGHRSF
jgi:hypothetical protein